MARALVCHCVGGLALGDEGEGEDEDVRMCEA